MFWVAVLMFAFSTTHVSLGFYRLIRGFIDLRDQEGGPGAYFSDVSTPPNVAKVTIHSVNSILGDSIVVCLPLHSSFLVLCAIYPRGPDAVMVRRYGDAGMCGAESGGSASCPSSSSSLLQVRASHEMSLIICPH